MIEYVTVIFLAVLPWIELRGAIPYGILMGLDPIIVFLLATSANMVIVYPLFLFLEWFFHLVERFPLMDKVIKRTHKKAKPYVEKYGMIGLAIFVGVPLPGTGAYTGSLAAHIFGIKDKRAVFSVMSGVFIAGVLITIFSTVLKGTFDWLYL